jgi:enamine deaminase RidA (YjgF/YER057c/UK114 family)
METPCGARWLRISRQVGVAPDGRLAEGAKAQTEHAWRNLMAVLHAAGMNQTRLVKITASPGARTWTWTARCAIRS